MTLVDSFPNFIRRVTKNRKSGNLYAIAGKTKKIIKERVPTVTEDLLQRFTVIVLHVKKSRAIFLDRTIPDSIVMKLIPWAKKLF